MQPERAVCGLTWCSRSAAEKGSYGQKNASYSLLRTTDGTIVYANRAADLTSFREDAAKKELQRLAQRYGTPRIIDMPRKPKSQQGMIASWGDVVLEPLDASSMSQLALGKSPNKGLIIDFLGNFRRSARAAGLPVYRMTGGAGFVWAASFNKKGAGTLRFAAVNPSALSAPVSAPPPVAAEPAAQPAKRSPGRAAGVGSARGSAPGAREPQPQPQMQSQAPAQPQPQPQLQSQAPAQPQPQRYSRKQWRLSHPGGSPLSQGAEPDTKLAELNQTIDKKLKSQLASYATDVIQLEKEKGEAQQALPQLHQALNDAGQFSLGQAQAAALGKGQLDAAIRRSNNLAYAMLSAPDSVRHPAHLWRGFRGQVETNVVGAARSRMKKLPRLSQQTAPAAVNAAGLLSESEITSPASMPTPRRHPPWCPIDSRQPRLRNRLCSHAR